MKLTGSMQWSGVDLDRLWGMIEQNAEVLIRCVPDTSNIKRLSPNEYSFDIMVHVGPVHGTFNAYVKINSIDKANGRVSMVLNSKGPGTSLTANVNAKIMQSGVEYDADVNISGILALIGERMIRNYIEGKLRDFMNNLTKLAKTGQC